MRGRGNWEEGVTRVWREGYGLLSRSKGMPGAILNGYLILPSRFHS